MYVCVCMYLLSTLSVSTCYTTSLYYSPSDLINVSTRVLHLYYSSC